MEMLENLNYIDYIIPFSEDTPLELIKKIHPNILVKGGDYKENQIVGADFVKSNNGIVKVINLTKGFSTTNLITKIKRQE